MINNDIRLTKYLNSISITGSRYVTFSAMALHWVLPVAHAFYTE